MPPKVCQDMNCPHIKEITHKQSFLHTCSFDSKCKSLFDPQHAHYFIHPCPFGKDCTLFNDEKHNINYSHDSTTFKQVVQKISSFFSDITNKFLPEEEAEEDLVGLRCPNWEHCNLTNDPNHNSQFYHPCKHGDKCNSLMNNKGEWSHKHKFHHPCKLGDKCKDSSKHHRYCFMHGGGDEPQWKECHGIEKKKKKIIDQHVTTNYNGNQRPANYYETTYQSSQWNGGSSGKAQQTSGSSSSSTSNGSYAATTAISTSPVYHHSSPTPTITSMLNHNYHQHFPIIQHHQHQQPTLQQPLPPPQYNFNQNYHQIYQQQQPSYQNVMVQQHQQPVYPNNNIGSNNNLSSFPPPTILVCTYNILAQSYVSLSRYSNIQNTKHLEWEERKFKIYSVLKERRFDVIGLQEVDNQHVSQIKFFLEQEGFHIFHSYKKHPKKDGLLIAIRNTKFEVLTQGDKVLVQDLPEVFQYVMVRDRIKGNCFCIVNSHLTFQPGDTGPREKQVREILKQLEILVNPQTTRIIWFGDFNTRPQEKPIQLIENSEKVQLKKSHQSLPEEFWTFCGTSGRNSVVDYIWHSPSLQVKSVSPSLDVLPTSSIPDGIHGSDHIPLIAEYLY